MEQLLISNVECLLHHAGTFISFASRQDLNKSGLDAHINTRIRIVNKHRNVADKLGWEPRRKYATARFSIGFCALEMNCSSDSMILTKPECDNTTRLSDLSLILISDAARTQSNILVTLEIHYMYENTSLMTTLSSGPDWSLRVQSLTCSLSV